MIWRIKRKIFGANFVFDIDTGLPIQAFYDYRLRRKWGNREFVDRSEGKRFISYCLSRLPRDSYITFYFDLMDGYFVQLCNSDGSIELDIPFWEGNVYYNRKKEVVSFLQSTGRGKNRYKAKESAVNENPFYVIQDSRKREAFRVKFGKDYNKATETVLSMVERIFNVENPKIYSYESQRLINTV